MQVELLKAWDDHSWDTEMVDIPEKEINNPTCDSLDEAIINWAYTHYSTLKSCKGLVHIGIYSYPPSNQE
jgi:hypothetical protein